MIKRLIFDVGFHKTMWFVRWRDFGRVHWFKTKAAAVNHATATARIHEGYGGLAQVVIRKKDGTIQSERTYPDVTPRRKG